MFGSSHQSNFMHIRYLTPLLAQLLCVVALSAQGWQPTTYNTTFISHWNPAVPGGRSSALWGYTAPDGREYALLGGYDGTYIVDISETPVRLVTKIPGPSNGWREIKTYSHYAYVVSEGGAGLQIVDLYDLPVTARLVRSDTSVLITGHTISAEGRYLYVHGTNTRAGANSGTIVFDVGPDPENPTVVGMYSEHYVHDAIIYNDTMYASAINNGRLDIVYLGRNRANPVLVTSISYPGAGTHNADLTADHRYVMTTDEVGATPKTLKIWDLADLQNIVKVADYTPVPGQIVHNVHTKGNLAIVAWYTAGTRIIDVSNPREPAELGFFDTNEGASASYAGNWETYPYFPSGRIIASDMQNGLYVFRFDGAIRGRIFGQVKDAVTGQPVPNALIDLPSLQRSLRTDALGNYVLAGAVDTIDFQASALNYRSAMGRLALAPAQGVEPGARYDIVLQPIPLATLTLRPIDEVTGEEIDSFSISVIERMMDRANVSGPYALLLPKDSTYHIVVGAWGYRPLRVELRNVLTGDYVVRLHRGYHDNVETDLGWSLRAPGDTASGGRWERGAPVETVAFDRVVQPGTQASPGGRIAFFTGLAGSEQGGAGANDLDGGQTTLTSPIMRLADSADPWVNLSWWYSRDVNQTNPIDDTLRFYLSVDNGTTWLEMAVLTESADTWQTQGWRIRDLAAPGDSTLFRVVASDFRSPSLVEAGVDDFVVTEGGPGPMIEDTATIDNTPTEGVRGRDRSISGGVFPNPATTDAELVLDVKTPVIGGDLDVFDASGRMIFSLSGLAPETGVWRLRLPTVFLPSGSYHWRFASRSTVPVVGSFVVVH